MVSTEPRPLPSPGRAGRDLRAAVVVAVALVVLILVSLAFNKAAFLVVVVAAILVALWELRHAIGARGANIPAPPLAVGAVFMIVGAYYGGADVLVVALATSVLVTVLWRMWHGPLGFVRDITASVFCLVYIPFLASFVSLLLAPHDGVDRVITFVAVTAASDIGGYAVGVLTGRHPMASAVSPNKTWEGFAGSVGASMGAGVLCIVLLLGGAWWVGLVLGAIAAVAGTLGDLAESLVKRDLGIKDMSNLLPGHGGIMDRLDSLLATVSVVWLVLHFLLPVA
jgi:phosphatidate cytidylyltransferase